MALYNIRVGRPAVYKKYMNFAFFLRFRLDTSIINQYLRINQAYSYYFHCGFLTRLLP